MKLELLIEGMWVDMPKDFLETIELHYNGQGTPIHFDSEKYQFYAMRLRNSSSSYTIYRIKKGVEEE